MKTISEEYAKLLEWEHANTPGEWGHTAEMYVHTIVKHCEDYTDWLDYGAGSGGLTKAATKLYGNRFNIKEYEPSRPNTVAPEPADYVVCIDVLEHVEPELIDNVLDDLQRVTSKKGYFTISCRPASKILKDGRNAHILIQPKEWWKKKLEPRFKIIEEGWDPSDKNYKVIVYARK